MKPKVLIYDFDGVICDSVGLKTDAFVELYRTESESIQKLIREYHLANGGISRFEKIKYFETVLLGKLYSEEDNIKLGQIFAELVKEKVIRSPFVLGVKEFLEKHSTDTLQYICTGTPEFEIKEIIERRGIGYLFKGLFGSPTIKSTIIQNIISEVGCTKDDCLFFGDALTDYKAASDSNVRFIGIKNDETIFPEGTFTIENFTDNKLEIFEL
jgi:phosphoglycolate phosphatase-like HAD superfamily hydrolase